MKTWKWRMLMGAVLVSASTLAATLAWSEGAEEEHREHASEATQSQALMHASGAMKDYKHECSACHMLYPASLLPARSWKHVMSQLDHHFGENAELSPDSRMEITKYLMKHAGDQGRNYFGRRINRSIPKNSAPMRITETGYFLRTHREVPSRDVGPNPKVRSFSNCIACHHGAERDSFDEDEVVIPGVRRFLRD